MARDAHELAALFGLARHLAHRTVDQVVDVHALALQHDLALGDAGHVDQVGDQAAQVVDLAFDDLAHHHQPVVAAFEPAQDGGGVGDRCQRVAQLVRQPGQEVFAAMTGQAQGARVRGELVFEQLAVGDVQATADVAQERTVGTEAWHAGVHHPAERSVLALQPVVHRERLALRKAVGDDADAAFGVLGMHALHPAAAEFLSQAATTKAQPRLVEPVARQVFVGHPQQHGRRVRRRLGSAFGLLHRTGGLHRGGHIAQHQKAVRGLTRRVTGGEQGGVDMVRRAGERARSQAACPAGVAMLRLRHGRVPRQARQLRERRVAAVHRQPGRSAVSAHHLSNGVQHQHRVRVVVEKRMRERVARQIWVGHRPGPVSNGWWRARSACLWHQCRHGCPMVSKTVRHPNVGEHAEQ